MDKPKRTAEDVILDIRDLLTEIDTRLVILHDELDLLREEWNIHNPA